MVIKEAKDFPDIKEFVVIINDINIKLEDVISVLKEYTLNIKLIFLKGFKSWYFFGKCWIHHKMKCHLKQRIYYKIRLI